jgi:hypothetical protein
MVTGSRLGSIIITFTHGVRSLPGDFYEVLK